MALSLYSRAIDKLKAALAEARAERIRALRVLGIPTATKIPLALASSYKLDGPVAELESATEDLDRLLDRQADLIERAKRLMLVHVDYEPEPFLPPPKEKKGLAYLMGVGTPFYSQGNFRFYITIELLAVTWVTGVVEESSVRTLGRFYIDDPFPETEGLQFANNNESVIRAYNPVSPGSTTPGTIIVWRLDEKLEPQEDLSVWKSVAFHHEDITVALTTNMTSNQLYWLWTDTNGNVIYNGQVTERTTSPATRGDMLPRYDAYEETKLTSSSPHVLYTWVTYTNDGTTETFEKFDEHGNKFVSTVCTVSPSSEGGTQWSWTNFNLDPFELGQDDHIIITEGSSGFHYRQDGWGFDGVGGRTSWSVEYDEGDKEAVWTTSLSHPPSSFMPNWFKAGTIYRTPFGGNGIDTNYVRTYLAGGSEVTQDVATPTGGNTLWSDLGMRIEYSDALCGAATAPSGTSLGSYGDDFFIGGNYIVSEGPWEATNSSFGISTGNNQGTWAYNRADHVYGTWTSSESGNYVWNESPVIESTGVIDAFGQVALRTAITTSVQSGFGKPYDLYQAQRAPNSWLQTVVPSCMIPGSDSRINAEAYRDTMDSTVKPFVETNHYQLYRGILGDQLLWDFGNKLPVYAGVAVDLSGLKVMLTVENPDTLYVERVVDDGVSSTHENIVDQFQNPLQYADTSERISRVFLQQLNGLYVIPGEDGTEFARLGYVLTDPFGDQMAIMKDAYIRIPVSISASDIKDMIDVSLGAYNNDQQKLPSY